MASKWSRWRSRWRSLWREKQLEPSDIFEPSRPSKSQPELLEKYKYPTLDADKPETRLFTLFPGERDDPICGTLTTVDLDATPQYDALSYLWGDPRPVTKVFLSDSRYIMVADNLRKGLVSLRQTTQSRVLWIDAISINQEDLRERGRQVEIMGIIYAQARLVRVWLDVDVDISSPPFRLLTNTTSPVEKTGPGASRHLVYNDYSSSFWRPIMKIFADPYWGRVWIQQELLLAKDICFHLPAGPLPAVVLINFHHFLEDARRELQGKWITLYSRISPFRFEYLDQRFFEAWPHKNFRGTSYTNNARLYSLFLSAGYLGSSDSRDRVYAMLALAMGKDQDQPSLKPDYSLNLENTYTALFRCHIQQHHTVEFLCHRSYASYNSFPTWLPSPEKHSYDLRSDLSLCRTGSRTLDPNATISGAAILTVRGIRCDLIRANSGVLLTRETVLALPHRHREMCRAAGLPVPPLEQTIDGNSLLGRLLLFKDADVALPSDFGRMGLTETDLHDWFGMLVEHISSDKITDLTIDNIAQKQEDIQQIMMSQNDLMFARFLRWRLELAMLVATDSARIGLGYLSCPERLPEASDQVWSIVGCPMPMVLRPVWNEVWTRYQVIGPAVFPGLMHEEAFDALEQDTDDPVFQDLKLETIELI